MKKVFLLLFLFITLLVIATSCVSNRSNQTPLLETSTEDADITESTESDADFALKYNIGTFDGQTLEETLQCMKPTAVHLHHSSDENGSITGSGFIIDISKDCLYICTSRHIIEAALDWQVFLADGTEVTGTAIGLSDVYDVGIVAVSLENLSAETLEYIKVVAIDKEYWSSIGHNQIKVGLIRVDDEGNTQYTLMGNVLRITIDFPWGTEPETELSLAQTDGDSGSAIFDQYGHLIAMVHGNSTDIGGTRNWAIPLNGILNAYEEITDKALVTK